ncbi:hypothetical protein N0V85_005153 [Neurospora sp. IMI 360204]|nr:hypothetical protein N0V85_005153 [Neurospora sp. IMI 360204]
MAFITISYQSRRVLVAKPQRLADLLRMAKEIFKPISDDVHLSIEFTDSTGNNAMVELHKSSYSILKDGDATFLIATSKKDNEHLDAALALLSLQDKGEAKVAAKRVEILTKSLKSMDAARSKVDEARRVVVARIEKRAAELGLVLSEEKQEEN